MLVSVVELFLILLLRDIVVFILLVESRCQWSRADDGVASSMESRPRWSRVIGGGGEGREGGKSEEFSAFAHPPATALVAGPSLEVI